MFNKKLKNEIMFLNDKIMELKYENKKLHERIENSEQTFGIRVGKLPSFAFQVQGYADEYLKKECIKQLVDKIANTNGFLKLVETETYIEYEITVKKQR